MPPTTFTLTGTWYKPDGVSFAAGTITMEPIQARDISGSSVIAGSDIVKTLVNGTFSQTLAQNENGYQITEEIDGAPPAVYTIPGNLSGTVDCKDYGPR